MYLSYSLNSDTSKAYMAIREINGPLEIRDYRAKSWVGGEVEFTNYLFVKEVDRVRDEVLAQNIEVDKFPYFLQFKDGKTYVFFNVNKDYVILNTEDLIIKTPPVDTVYMGFNWHPTKRNSKSTYEKIKKVLEDSNMNFNDGEYFVEVTAPLKVIPFMAHNGVFIERL